MTKFEVFIAIIAEYFPVGLKYSRKNAEKLVYTCYFAIFTVNLWQIMSAYHRKQCNIVNVLQEGENRTHL